jgi:hypothetical protein
MGGPGVGLKPVVQRRRFLQPSGQTSQYSQDFE